MKNYRAALLLVAAILIASFAGCGPSSEPDQLPGAWSFHPNSPKYKSDQTHCAVCGGTPIKEEFSTEVGRANMKVYFCSQECMEKFESDPEKSLQEFDKQVQDRIKGMEAQEKSFQDFLDERENKGN